MTKRVLSLLLVLVMVLSLSVPALAAEGEETAVAAVEQTETTPAADEPVAAAEAVDEPAEVWEVGEALYDNGDVQSALDNNENPIQLTYTINDTTKTAVVRHDVTIDLNGYSLNAIEVEKGTLTVIDGYAEYGHENSLESVKVGPNGTLVVQSGTVDAIDNEGVVNVTGGTVASATGGDVNLSAGVLTGWTPGDKDNPATLNVTGGKVTSRITIDNSGNDYGTVNVKGGETKGFSLSSSHGVLNISGGKVAGLIAYTDGTLNISGGVIDNRAGDAVSSGDFAIRLNAGGTRGDIHCEISGGTIIAKKQAISVKPGSDTVDGYITGGRFVPCIGGEKDSDSFDNVDVETKFGSTVVHIADSSERDYPEYTLVGRAACEEAVGRITKGVVTHLKGSADYTGVHDDVSVENASEQDTITVTGDDNKSETLEPEGTWGKWEAMIGSKKYEHFYDPDHPAKSALVQFKTGQTITLLKTVEVPTPGYVVTDKNLTIDLNNHSLNLKGSIGVSNSTPLVRSRTIRFTGKGAVNGQNSVNWTGALNVFGGNIVIDLVDTYFHAPIYCNENASGNKLTVGADAFLAGMAGAQNARFNGSVTVLGRVLGDLYVDARNKFEVNIQGTVDKNVWVCGDVGTFKMFPNAKIGGDLVLGAWEGRTGGRVDNEMTIQITGGEVLGSVKLYIERHSDAVISDGEFGGDADLNTHFASLDDVHGISPEQYLSVTGGAFAHDADNRPHPYVVGNTPVATIEDAAETNAYELSGWWLVGNTKVADALTKVSSGYLNLEKGFLSLATIPDNVYVSATGGKIAINYVTIAAQTEEEILGKYINDLNALIARAYNATASGKIDEADQKALTNAVMDALADKKGYDPDPFDYDPTVVDPELYVKDAIEQLQKLLDEKFPETDPNVPWVPPQTFTGWHKNTEGDWYFFLNGRKLTNCWVYSEHMIWYYVGDDGVMATGVKYVYAAPTYNTITHTYNSHNEPAGWYYFETAADSDAPGRIRGGWHTASPFGDVWSNPVHDGTYGMITWARYDQNGNKLGGRIPNP